MICADCGIKMILKQAGIVSQSVGYECPKCGLRNGFHIYEIYEKPSPELQAMLDELYEMNPLNPIKNKEGWYEKLDLILDKQGITVYSQSKNFIDEYSSKVEEVKNDG